jgi:sugar O-acyltransferase (sialic acid O-acetyltransferase NeuD family)
MQQLVIIGTGAVAAEITSYIEDPQYTSGYNVSIKGYLDIDDKNMYKYRYKYPYLGNAENYIVEEQDFFVVAIGNNLYRKEYTEKIIARKGKFLNLIHPTSIIANTSAIGFGNIVNPFSMIGPNTKIGNCNLLTSYSIISHDCCIGNYNFFSTTCICGNVQISNENVFNIRSTVIPSIKIGNNNVIQAGMVVDKNIADGETIFYRFREKVIAIPKENN